MIDVVYNIIDDDYVLFLLNNINDKNFDTPITSTSFKNYYNRYKLEPKDYLKQQLESYLSEKYGKPYVLQNNGFWINKVTTESNKDDEFHIDDSDLSIVTYLNDDFEGGYFEYIDSKNEKIKIKPQRGMSIIINSKIEHRVLPVKKGTRYSGVFFFDYITKNKKTLL